MESTHTIKHMRSTALFPDVATREMQDLWEEKGKHDAEARALNLAGNILTKDNPAVFSEDIDAKIRARFKGLVEGKTGWNE